VNLRNCEGLGRHQRQRQHAAAADQALQVKEGPPANGGERGSEKCGRDVAGSGGSSGQGKQIVEAFMTRVGVEM
jgi:hypothetical protein